MNVSGGTVGDRLYAKHNSTVNVSDGSIGWALLAYDDSTLTVSGGAIGRDLAAYNDRGVAFHLLGDERGHLPTSLRRLRDFEPAVLVAPNNIVTAPLYAPYALSQDIWPTGSQSIFLVGFGMFQIGRPYVILPASCGR